jgi:hypothetical protein
MQILSRALKTLCVTLYNIGIAFHPYLRGKNAVEVVFCRVSEKGKKKAFVFLYT